MQQKIVILGAAESGVGTAILAKQKGFDVFVSDNKQIKAHYKKVLLDSQINFEEGKHTLSILYSADLVVKSPGIPDQIPVITSLNQKNIPVISEIEFASRYVETKPIIAVTGSNGKTTTTSLIAYLLNQNKSSQTALCGNIGDSFAKMVADNANQFKSYTIEVSSFQLDGTFNFCPHIAVMTNITPDHLDRYDYNFMNYVASKFKLIQAQGISDIFIYNSDDKVIIDYISSRSNIKSRLVPFSIKKPLPMGAFLSQGNMVFRLPISQSDGKEEQQQEIIIPLSKLSILGKHNIQNALAAITASLLAKDVTVNNISNSLSNFSAIEHRLELVSTEYDSITFINDSKATNVESVYYALEAITTKVVWIVGGVDKGNDYSILEHLVEDKVRAIICLGLDNQKILDFFATKVSQITQVDSMEKAVLTSLAYSNKGDTILLSPACASFDLFSNYEDRGMQFKKYVKSYAVV